MYDVPDRATVPTTKAAVCGTVNGTMEAAFSVVWTAVDALAAMTLPFFDSLLSVTKRFNHKGGGDITEANVEVFV